jgi:hypothetical protein
MNGMIARVRRFVVSERGPTAIKIALEVARIIVAWVTIGTLGGSSGA